MDTPAKKASRKRTPKQQDMQGIILQCSFCGRTQHDVNQLIAGKDALICDKCVLECSRIIAEAVAARPSKTIG